MNIVKSSRSVGFSLVLFIGCIILTLVFSAVEAGADYTGQFTFYEVGPANYQYIEYDQSGWITVYADNQTNVAWGDFHFFLFDLNNYPNAPDSSIVFDVNAPNQPQSSQSPLTWTLSSGNQVIDLFYYSDPYAPGATGGYWKVHVDNPNQILHGVGFYPTIVPEPVSSALFIVGGATFGFRRLWRRRKTL